MFNFWWWRQLWCCGCGLQVCGASVGVVNVSIMAQMPVRVCDCDGDTGGAGGGVVGGVVTDQQ